MGEKRIISTGRRGLAKKIAIGVGLLVVVIVWSRPERAAVADPEFLRALLEDYPRSAPLVFVLLYSVMSVFLLPTLPLNLGAGILWGPVMGGLYSVIGTTVSASISFLVSRHLFSDYFDRRFNDGVWAVLREDIVRNDWKVVAFTRLNPIFPTGLVNYCYGVTRMSFGTYLWSTFLFLTPGAIFFASLGFVVGDAAQMGDVRGLATPVLILSAAATVMALLRYWFRRKDRFLALTDSVGAEDGDAEPGPG